jgi:hypothetical protein
MDHLEIESSVLCSMLLMTWIELLVWGDFCMYRQRIGRDRLPDMVVFGVALQLIIKSLIMRLKRVGLMTEPFGVPLSKECNFEVA